MPKSYQEPRKSRQKPIRKRLLGWGFLVILIFALGLYVGYLKIEKGPSPQSVATETPAPLNREVLLYFASPDGQTLVAEARNINECQQDEACLRDAIMALIEGPQGDLVAILPSQVVLHDVSVVDSLVRVDFSSELISAHPGGTQSELLTVYGLADTLAVNFPHLRQVQVLVDGAPVSTLKGHVDLRQPINPDFSLVKEGGVAGGRIITLPAGSEE